MTQTLRAAIALVLLLAGSAFAQQTPPVTAPAAQPATPPAAPAPVDFSKVEIKTTDLGDNVYMLEGQNPGSWPPAGCRQDGWGRHPDSYPESMLVSAFVFR